MPTRLVEIKARYATNGMPKTRVFTFGYGFLQAYWMDTIPNPQRDDSKVHGLDLHSGVVVIHTM